MPNHFHFLVRVKSESEQITFRTTNLRPDLPDRFLHASKQFSHLCNSHTKYMNRKYQRVGSLFQEHFGAKEISEERYFSSVIQYINLNPVKHGFVEKPEDWVFSSYQATLSNKTTLLQRQTVLDWFMGKDEFIRLHSPDAVRFYEH